MIKKRKNSQVDKLFLVRKYIWAKDASSAIKKDKHHKVDDVWVDEDWKKMSNHPKDAIGFYVENPEDNQ